MKRRSLFRARVVRAFRLVTAYSAFGLAVLLGGFVWVAWNLAEPAIERLAAYSYYPEG